MSWTTGYCYLFVTCKDAEQCNELIQRFETEIQDANYFHYISNTMHLLNLIFH